jgi:hypothetical protein
MPVFMLALFGRRVKIWPPKKLLQKGHLYDKVQLNRMKICDFIA